MTGTAGEKSDSALLKPAPRARVARLALGGLIWLLTHRQIDEKLGHSNRENSPDHGLWLNPNELIDHFTR